MRAISILTKAVVLVCAIIILYYGAKVEDVGISLSIMGTGLIVAYMVIIWTDICLQIDELKERK